MYIEQALFSKLDGTSAITALVGHRIEYIRARQDVKSPYIVFQKISDIPKAKTLDGASPLQEARFQISVFASSYKTCKDIADAIQTAIDGFKGTMGGTGGVSVGDCAHDNDNDLPYDEPTQLFGIEADYLIIYTR